MVSLRHLSRHLLCFIALVMLFSTRGTDAASVTPGISLSTSDQTIYLGDTVVVEVEAIGLTDTVEISPLLSGADLLRETTGTRIAVIDGRVVEVKLRRMELLPRKEGRVFFGPLSGSSIKGSVSSNTLIIDVQPAVSTHWLPDDRDLQIDLVIRLDGSAVPLIDSKSVPPAPSNSDTKSLANETRPTPFIGQHLIADITLRHRYPVIDESLTIPAFAGFDVLSEFEQRRTIEGQDSDQSWRVVAWRYHLFAQRSGNIDIDSIRWRGTLVRSRTQRATFERSTTPVSVSIQPAVRTTDWWLPATAVSLEDSWSKDPRELSAGDEILRTITLSAQNVMANHLPEVVPLDSRALSTTLIRQNRTHKLVGDALEAKAVFEFRMIAQSPIPVFLDTVRVPWYSTLESTSKEAIIPARRIDVGLPERADLLADIALNDSRLDKWQLALQGSAAHLVPWHVTLTLLSLLAIVLWFREWLARRRPEKHRSTSALPEL